MPSIVYPITRNYRAQWELPDAFRECIWQEFLDLFEDWIIEQADGRTVTVPGAAPHHHLALIMSPI